VKVSSATFDVKEAVIVTVEVSVATLESLAALRVSEAVLDTRP
jgi:hypothetical protein